MQKSTQKKAVIYCRVSSKKQVEEGHGLESQETRCREFAKFRDYDVVKAFHDEGVSGGKIKRSAMNELLIFVKKLGDNPIVIIDDISRLARGLEAHLHLCMDINKAGGKLESPSIEFGEDSPTVYWWKTSWRVSANTNDKKTQSKSSIECERVP